MSETKSVRGMPAKGMTAKKSLGQTVADGLMGLGRPAPRTRSKKTAGATALDSSEQALQKRLGYTFSAPRILIAALTHSSARAGAVVAKNSRKAHDQSAEGFEPGGDRDNERLEFWATVCWALRPRNC